MKKYKLWKILTIVFAFLLVVMIVANVICNMYATTLNWVLGIQTSQVINPDEPGPTYFPSEFARKDSNGNSILDSNYKEQHHRAGSDQRGHCSFKERRRASP